MYNILNRAPDFYGPDGAQEVGAPYSCQSFIRSLLRQRVEYRLGSKAGAQELRNHPWLASDAGPSS